MIKSRKIKWDKEAADSFKDAIEYIGNQSLQGAEKVKKQILEKIASLALHPEAYPPDKYKRPNPGKLQRAFELYHYRISYLITDDSIIISRIRHTAQRPLDF